MPIQAARSLAERCRHSFVPAVRRQGEYELHQNLRDVYLSEDDRALAVFRGARDLRGRRADIEVVVEWLPIEDGFIAVWCPCSPHRRVGSPCRHVWAVLLRLDLMDAIELGSVPDELKVLCVPEVADDLPELEPTIDPLTTLRERLATVRGQLAPPPARRRPRQAWFVLRPDHSSPDDGALRIHFHRRDTLRSGQLGKMKPGPVGPRDLAAYDDADRELLTLLLGLAAGDW
ncbi:MAG: hypothetical protein AAGE94_25235, partial [Acidobacteriota bacterium]